MMESMKADRLFSRGLDRFLDIGNDFRTVSSRDV